MSRDSMDYDVVVVGAGPAGLAAAIRLKQIAADISVCVVEKGSEVGAHILSGAVMDPRAINELIPEWKKKGAPLDTPVSEDRFLFLTETKALRTPSFLLPRCFKNDGNYVISLGALTRWLGKQAEELGVDVFPGFPAQHILFENDAVKGVVTGDIGIGRKGDKTRSYQQGMELHAKYTLFAEGCRGHLGRQLEEKLNLRGHAGPQVYGIGLKELWEIKPERHHPGLVMHTAGWPLSSNTYGGSFIYHQANNQVAVGFVVGLGYRNPYLSPYEEFQRFKTHPVVREIFHGGKRLSYGARAISAGGLQSLPRFVFRGGALIGDDAGFLNASRIKGSHCAIKSGTLAADATAEALKADRAGDELTAYSESFRASWLYDELYRARNFKPWLSKGLYLGALMVGVDQIILRGKAPWTLRHKGHDYAQLAPADLFSPIRYQRPDGVLTFDRLSSVFISNTNHNEDQPVHLTLKHEEIPVDVNLKQYAGPEQRYCPAGVYEFVETETSARLQINAQNCIHCKTCDIKDPRQNIVWVAPEGGGGPSYPNM